MNTAHRCNGFTRLGLPALLLCAAIAPIAWSSFGHADERAVAIPPPKVDEKSGLTRSDQTGSDQSRETAVLAGGCFWGVQGVFQHVKGVTNAVSGYTGGDKDSAHYGAVGSGTTGHAESVRISYDPQQITYGQLLQIYFSVAHDPTEKDRQGPDTGTQYRSTIFATTPEQARIASDYIAQLGTAHAYPAPIVTTIETGKTFYPAEDYHQDFLARNPTYGYIVVNDLPKIEHLKQMFPDRYRDKADLVAVSVR